MANPTSTTCNVCGKPRTYNNRHDAMYCADCDVWLEKRCSDGACMYCASRPDKPSAADREDDWVDE